MKHGFTKCFRDALKAKENLRYTQIEVYYAGFLIVNVETLVMHGMKQSFENQKFI